MQTEKQSSDDAFKTGVNKVVHNIPHDYELSKMSFVELAIELASSKKDSPKFIVFEREIKKHIAKDQAKINRGNIILGACIGLVGVFLGAWLKESPPTRQVAPSNTVQQYKNIKLPVADVEPKPTATNP
ncbi:hypothetical protein [Methylobacter sp. sgz302048]|uniref:hypothetical protein n=1 Tax=Methylobacter sp. sgz302048 TaxID=3455945 RepID=UPI003FA094C0